MYCPESQGEKRKKGRNITSSNASDGSSKMRTQINTELSSTKVTCNLDKSCFSVVEGKPDSKENGRRMGGSVMRELLCV